MAGTTITGGNKPTNTLTVNDDGSVNAVIVSGGGGGGGAVTDLVATGNLTAAQATQVTPVANATVALALGSGQATWEAQITGLGSGSTIAFDGVDDVGVSTNWEAAVGYQSNIINPPPITSIAGPGPFIVRGTSSGYEQVRMRCAVYNGTDTIAVRLIGSVGGLAGAGGIVSNDGTFAKESGGNLALMKTDLDALNTVTGLTSDAAVTGDTPGTNSAKLRGLSKIFADIWDSTNHWLQVKVMNGNANGQATKNNSAPVVPASDWFGPLQLADGTTTSQKAAIDVSGNLSVKVGPALPAGTNLIGAIMRAAVALFTTTQTTTGTGDSGDITVGPYTEISIDITTSAQAGTNPTIQFFYKRKGADGLYYALWQSAVLSAAANTISTSIGAGMAYNQSLGLTGKLTWVVGGSATPTWTFTPNIYGK